MIQVVNRAFDIIEFIASSGRKDIPLKEIADGLQLNQGTCANIIKTMVSRGYLEKSSSKKGYSLGPMLYFITGDYSYSVDLINAAKEPMYLLTEKINESCMLGVVRNDIRISLYEVHAEQEIRVVNKKEKALYQTASGRLLLAYLPLAKQKEFIKKYGLPKEEVWEDGADEEGLFMELKKIKKKEMAIQVAPSKILGIALPVGEPGDVIASLGVYLPEFRFSGEKKDQIIEAMKEATKQINGVLRKQAHKVTIDNS